MVFTIKQAKGLRDGVIGLCQAGDVYDLFVKIDNAITQATGQDIEIDFTETERLFIIDLLGKFQILKVIDLLKKFKS